MYCCMTFIARFWPLHAGFEWLVVLRLVLIKSPQFCACFANRAPSLFTASEYYTIILCYCIMLRCYATPLCY